MPKILDCTLSGVGIKLIHTCQWADSWQHQNCLIT